MSLDTASAGTETLPPPERRALSKFLRNKAAVAGAVIVVQRPLDRPDKIVSVEIHEPFDD